MSTSGRKAGRIMVAASCCSSWDEYVAGAVMTYFPNKTKDPNIDGTITLPFNVKCEAFSLSDGRQMDPCESCVTLFALTNINPNPDVKIKNPGNCAEVESLSNLFKSERQVKEQATADRQTEIRQKCLEDVLAHLKSLLNNKDVKKDEDVKKVEEFIWDGQFYTPQRASL